MAEIRSDETKEFSAWQKIEFMFSHPMLFRPLGNLAVIVLVLIAGSWAAVASVQNSMPDHFLYPAKVTLEKVELALTVDGQAKVSKQTSLAQKRVGELQYLVAVADMPITSLHVDKTVRNIKQNLQDAQDSLNKLNASGDDEDFSKVVEEVEKSANKISRSLKETSAKLPAEVQVSVSQELAETAEEVSDISAQAFDLLIKNWLTDDQIPEEKIKVKIEEKISELKASYESLDVAGWLEENEAQEEADEALLARVEQVQQVSGEIEADFVASQEMLVEKDYVGILNIIEKIRQDTNSLEKLLQGANVLGEEETQDGSVDEEEAVKPETETSTDDIIK